MRILHAFLFLAVSLSAHPQSLSDVMFKSGPPRLTIFISIDQFRADYLTRFRDLYLPANSRGRVGGFRFLMESGAWFANARYDHLPTETGPGHAILGTGAPPYVNGIVANEWRDRKTGKSVYCTADSDAAPVGGGKVGMSPRNLLVSTYGDELKRVTGGRSKNVSVSWKDRAAILMAGHLSDGVVWFDAGAKGWVTSAFYGKQVPAWAAAMSVERFKNRAWDVTVNRQALERCQPFDPGWLQPSSFGPSFPHKVGEDASFYSLLRLTPFSTQHTLETAEAAIAAEKMGADDVPDSLTISLSANDYVGHMFGPDSPETLQLAVDTDRLLSDFFNWVDKNVPGGLSSCLVALCADHGVAPVTESVSEKFNVRRIPNLVNVVNTALDAAVPAGAPWKVDFTEPYFSYERKAGIPDAQVEAAIVQALTDQPSVFCAYTRSQMTEGRLPANEIGRAVSRSFRPDRCGDVVVVFNPWWQGGGVPSSYTTGHGQPFPYDQAVPILLRGPGIKKGIYTERVSPEDIAPTLCAVLGIPVPSGCMGNPIGLDK